MYEKPEIHNHSAGKLNVTKHEDFKNANLNKYGYNELSQLEFNQISEHPWS